MTLDIKGSLLGVTLNLSTKTTLPGAVMRSIYLTVFIVSLIFSQPTFSNDQNGTKYIETEHAVGLIHDVHVVIQDGVVDRCWTNIDAVKNSVTASLEQAGIRTHEESLAFYDGSTVRLTVAANGYRTNDGLCLSSLTFDVAMPLYNAFTQRESGDVWKVQMPATVISNGMVMSGPNRLNQQISDNVDSYTNEFITRIYSGRRVDAVREVLEALPHLSDEPMTQKRYEEILGNIDN